VGRATPFVTKYNALMTRNLVCLLCGCVLAQLVSTSVFAAQPPPAGEASKNAGSVVATTPTAEPTPAISHDAETAVVKVFSTMRRPDLLKPWTKQAPAEVTGSGVVIEGHRILTNAHVVNYASQVQVQGNQAGDKVFATVVAIAPGIDLAVLQVDDKSFFDSRPPLPRASVLPQIKDPVLAYGFPTGGTSLSITKGIVSRIEFVPYNFPVSGLRIQIDAAINPGNSGGPAVAGDKMIGLAFSTLNNAQNIGYIIPNEEIELFLKDIADGRYDGKPSMYDELQTLENPALRALLKADASVQGMVVHRPFDTGASYPLKEWDVITRIADTPIDDEGMIKLGSNLRVDFRYLIQNVASKGTVPLTVVRSGKTLQIQLPAPSTRPLLIPSLNGDYPPYFIYGPMVFSKATLQFDQFLNVRAQYASVLGFVHSPLVIRVGDAPDAEREELVIVSSPLFPHKLSKGYSNPSGGVVYAVNGTKIRSLAHLVAVLRDLKDEFVTFEFDGEGGEGLVFPRAAAVAATDDILNDNDVRAQGSPDMLKVWQAKASR
jgi:S1-C subfamily serine protease